MEPTLDLAARPGWTFLDEVEDGGSSSLQMWQQLLFCWLRLLMALNNVDVNLSLLELCMHVDEITARH